ncbi:MAG: methylated-DNA--[protein]-cysteine S-methyltransferase [Candidatus Wallbacteria bacterium]|nr:methylated-DNA--[protein]-cysteine S-methyltransferase [Candidatus Wallbacteria bacterium]
MSASFRVSASFRAKSKGGDARWCVFDTLLGECGVVWTAAGVRALVLPEEDIESLQQRLASLGATPGEPPAAVDKLIGLVGRYCAGEPVDFGKVKLDLAGVAEFARAVYESTRAIPWGLTATYGGIARDIGKPGSARAVGQALGRNPVAIVIPCHRVLAASGLGGFSAAGGARLKEKMLALELVRRPGL